MGDFADIELNKKNIVQKNNDGHQTHILQSKEQVNDPAAKLQNLADHSNIVSQLSAFQEMADGSPHSEQTIQLQSNADNNQAEVVQRIGGLIANATRGFARKAIPMAGRAINTAGRSASKGEKAFKYGSNALAIGGGAAEISKLHQEGKFGMNRESIIAGLGVHNPFGSYGTAASLASNLYDAGQVIYKEAEKDGDKFTLNEGNFKSFMLTAASLTGNVLDLNGGKGVEVVSKFLSNVGDIDKILQDEGQLKDTFIGIHEELSEMMGQNDDDIFRNGLDDEMGGYMI